MPTDDDSKHLDPRQSAARRSRDDLLSMWSDLADQDAVDSAAHLPTLIEEVSRQAASTAAEVGRLKHAVRRLEAVAQPADAVSDLLSLFDGLEAALTRLRERLPPLP